MSAAESRRTCPDDDRYLTAAEFVALPAVAHHAIWRAYAERRVEAVPVAGRGPGGSLRYRRDQVEALLRELAGAGT